MQFYIMTLFPDMVMDGLNTSIIGRAMDKGLLDIEAVNIRDYAFNKHNSVDDYPYGGGGCEKENRNESFAKRSGYQEKPACDLSVSTGKDI